MTPTQITLVKQSFARVAPRADRFVADFYRRLFELEPDVRSMFTSDLETQGARLLRVLGLAIGRLDEVETLLDTLRGLGARHVAYGVEERHYPIVAAALLDTLEAHLGETFRDETREAWTVAYGALAGAMIEGARMAEQDAA